MLLVTSSNIGCSKVDNNAFILLYTSYNKMNMSEATYSNLQELLGGSIKQEELECGSGSWLCICLGFLRVTSIQILVLNSIQQAGVSIKQAN